MPQDEETRVLRRSCLLTDVSDSAPRIDGSHGHVWEASMLCIPDADACKLAHLTLRRPPNGSCVLS